MQSDHYGVQIEDGLPIFPENVKANIPLKIHVRVIYLKKDFEIISTTELELAYRLRAFHLWWFMRIVHIDNEGKNEGATLVHAWIEGMSTDKVCT